MSFAPDVPIIYLITKGEAEASNFDKKRSEILDIIRLAVEESVSLVQIREKKLSARLLFELTVKASAIIRGSRTRLLVNDRADIALAARADGVHLTTNSLSCEVIRKTFPKDFIIGQSAHTVEEAMRANGDGADFVVFGPVFETPGKDLFQGITELSHVSERVAPLPVLAIGGVDRTNIASVIEKGAAGFGAIRALNDPECLKEICREYRNGAVSNR